MRRTEGPRGAGTARRVKPRAPTPAPALAPPLLPELSFELSEPGPPAGVVGPAFRHKAVEGRRAIWRHWQSLPILNSPDHVIVLHSLKRLHTMHQYLPHTHTCEVGMETDCELGRQRRQPGRREGASPLALEDWLRDSGQTAKYGSSVTSAVNKSSTINFTGCESRNTKY